jgi:hypothetical protein
MKLTEKDAFDVKRTISPGSFEKTPYSLEELRFKTGDGLTLNGWFIEHDESSPTVLYLGGNGFVMATSYNIIMSIISQQANLFVFDYRGYGENPGTPTIEGLKQDGLAAYDYVVTSKQIDPGKLVIHGHSLGTFFASFIATERESAGLVLESPITDAKDWTGRLVPWFLKPFVRFDIDPVLLADSNTDRLSRFEKPLLIFACENDQVTPPGMAEKIFENAKSTDKQLVIIENGGHNDLPQSERYMDTLNRFYQTLR